MGVAKQLTSLWGKHLATLVVSLRKQQWCNDLLHLISLFSSLVVEDIILVLRNALNRFTILNGKQLRTTPHFMGNMNTPNCQLLPPHRWIFRLFSLVPGDT